MPRVRCRCSGAQLILHDKVREVFESSLRLARQSGYLKKRGMRVALDTTYILGRGAVKDTYNLLADGIVKLLRVLAAVANIAVGEWAEAQGYERYFGSSIKGEAVIDWSDRKARRKLLGEIVADADRLLELARQAWVELPEDSGQRQSIVDGAELLGQLLLQDVERKSGNGDVDADADAADDGVSVKDGVSKDRMLSVHDPELRHGHKSSRRRFNGHKAGHRGGHRLPADHRRGCVARQRSRQFGSIGTGGGQRNEYRLGGGGKPWATPPMGTAGLARPSPTRDAGWWPKCRAGPTGNTFPKMTFTLTVHLSGGAGYPRHRAGGKRTDRAGRVYRLQAFQFDGRYVGYVHCGPVHRGPRQEGSRC